MALSDLLKTVLAQRAEPTTTEESSQERRGALAAVKAHVDDLDVELRVVSKAKTPLGDFMAEGGGWKGEPPEEILRILREAGSTRSKSKAKF